MGRPEDYLRCPSTVLDIVSWLSTACFHQASWSASFQGFSCLPLSILEHWNWKGLLPCSGSRDSDSGLYAYLTSASSKVIYLESVFDIFIQTCFWSVFKETQGIRKGPCLCGCGEQTGRDVHSQTRRHCNRIQGVLSILRAFCLGACRSLELRLLSYIDLVNGDEKVPRDSHVTTTLCPELTLF